MIPALLDKGPVTDSVHENALSVRISRAWVAGGDVLGSLNLDIRKGETVALTGPSGVGKSTLLRIISGLHLEYEGTVLAPKRIAMVFQEPHLLPWRSALNNITLTSGCSPSTANHWLETVGLKAHKDKYPGQLSLGEQRRLSLARAFAASPDLLLMDEPFVSLDPKLANDMMTLSQNLISEQNVTTILVTHVEAEAHRMALRQLRLVGRPAQLAST